MIDLDALTALRTVSTVGTLARAAELLGFTASAISQQIKRLERQVGVPLMAAAGRGVVLTPAGQALVDASPEVFHALERCTVAARSVAEGAPRGTVTVVGFATAIRGLLAPALQRLAPSYPDLAIRIEEADPQDALQRVEVGTADLALIHDADGIPAATPESMVQRAVHTDLGDLVLRRDHPLAALQRPLSSADLAGQTWVTSPPGTVCHQWFRRLLAGEPEPDVRHLVDDFATQLALVEATGSIALIPRLARPPLSAELVERELRRPPKREVYAVWRRSADAAPGVRAVLAHLS